MKQTISIIYTNRLVADALKCTIEKNMEIKVNDLWEIGSLKGFSRKCDERIILIEILTPTFMLLETVKKFKSLGFKVMIVGHMAKNGLLEEILDAGLDAYVLKKCSKHNLFAGIQQVISNNKFFCSSITEALNVKLHSKLHHDENELTNREKEVLKGVVNFMSTTQLANHLHISAATVRTHRKNIMSKLGARNYLGLIRRACSEGLFVDDDDHFCNGCVKNKCPHSTF